MTSAFRKIVQADVYDERLIKHAGARTPRAD